MQLILSQVYTPLRLGQAWLKTFYLNRYLRIMPTYAIAVGATLAVAGGYALIRPGLAIEPFSAWSAIAELKNSIPNIILKIYLLLTNLFVFFQDASLFIGVQDGSARFVSDFSDSQIRIYEALTIPQAWSVGVELSFYMLAPFALKRSTRKLAGLALVLFACKASFLTIFSGNFESSLGFSTITNLDGLWGYRFFPFELPYFIAGAIAQRFMDPASHMIGQHNRYKKLVAYGLIILAVTAGSNWLQSPGAAWIAPFIFAIATPFLFQLFKHSPQDKALGDLSYPFYMLHVLCLRLTNPIQVPHLQALGPLIALMMTLLLSAACLKSEGWIETVRRRLKSSPSGDTAPLSSPSA